MFHVRAVTIDHYVSKSINELYGENQSRISSHWLEPVVRMFGSTPEGVKSCVHIHGVFPYIYVPYTGGENPDRDALILGAALEEALKMAYNQSKSKFVAKVTVVAGIPLYGYHSNPRQFFKIFFYNPFHIRKTSELLLNGAILGQKLQPHEAHIPYVLQFMMDYNVYGMSFVTFSKVKYRRNPDNPESLSDVGRDCLLSDKVKRTTCSHFEVDALASDIVIRKSDGGGLQSNPGLQAIWENEKIRRKRQNKPSQFTIQESQSRECDVVGPAEALYKKQLAAKLMETAKPVSSGECTELKLSYPAEVSADRGNLLDASALLEDDDLSPRDDPSLTGDDLPDVSLYIDEKIISAIVTGDGSGSSGREGGGIGVEETDEGVEADSILGKDQVGGEAEEEPEMDDGGDMTQPLDAEEEEDSDGDGDEDADEDEGEDGANSSNANVEGRQESGNSDREEFWANMADRILQIDGAQDSSSDSDVEATMKSSGGPNLGYSLERDVNTNPTPQPVSNESLTSILSILSDSNGSSTMPTIVAQGPALWSSFSPRVDCSGWLSQPQQEPWLWDKVENCFADSLPGRNQAVGLPVDLPMAVVSKPADVLGPGDAFSSPFATSGYEDYASTSTSPCSNVDSNFPDSPCLTVLTPSNRVDSYSNVANIGTVGESSGDVYRSGFDAVPGQNPAKKDGTIGSNRIVSATAVSSGSASAGRKVKAVNEKVLADIRTENRSVSLTLKQYLKDFGEIVSVDLNHFNNQDMVVIEYKPFHEKTTQNKFFIKPLDMFLENWNVAERKINGELGNGDGKDSGKVTGNPLPACEETCSSSRSNTAPFNGKIIFKSMEILPDKSEILTPSKVKTRDVRQELISRNGPGVKCQLGGRKDGKSVGKRVLVENDLNDNHILSRSTGHFVRNELDNTTVGKRRLKVLNCKEKTETKVGPDSGIPEVGIRERKRKGSNLVRTTWNSGGIRDPRNLSQLDVKLIDQINSCFEDYFKNIVKVNNSSAVNKNNYKGRNGGRSPSSRVIIHPDDAQDEEDDDDDDEDNDEDDCEDDVNENSVDSRNNYRPEKSGTKRLVGSTGGTLESVEFVAELLSTVSKMSETREIPPLSITINIGSDDSSGGNCAPVQLNVTRPTDGRTKAAKSKRKFKIQNVDGPADGSSSSSSRSSSSSEESLGRLREDRYEGSRPVKRVKKRDGYYKALNVVLQRSASKDKNVVSGKLESSKGSQGGREQREATRRRKGSQSGLKSDSEVTPKARRRPKLHVTKCQSPWAGIRSAGKGPDDVQKTEEPDVIYDSDAGSKASRFGRKRKKRKSSRVKSPEKVGNSDLVLENEGSFEKTQQDQQAGDPLCVRLSETVEIPAWSAVRNPSEILPESSACTSGPGVTCRLNETYVLDEPEILENTSADSKYPSLPSKENSNDSVKTSIGSHVSGLSLSGSPLCSPADEDSHQQHHAFTVHPSTSKTVSVVDYKCESSNFSSPLLPEDYNDSLDRTLVPDETLPSSSTKNSTDSNMSHPVLSLMESKVIVPKCKPPSRNIVRSFLYTNEDVKCPTEAPFYGDPRDVTKGMEMGPVVLRVETNAVSGLKVHKSFLDLIGLEERRATFSGREGSDRKNSVRCLLVPDRVVTITPLRKPPTSGSVCRRETTESERQVEEGKRRKIKVVVPTSPGGGSESEEEVDVTLSSSTIRDDDEMSQSRSGEIRQSQDRLSQTKAPSTQMGTATGKPEVILEESNSESASEYSIGKCVGQSSDNSFQIRGVTLENTYGFDNSIENLQNVKLNHTHQFLTMLVMELHVQTRQDLRPDPRHDPIRALFYRISFDSPVKEDETGVVVVGDDTLSGCAISNALTVHRVSTEGSLLLKLVDLVKTWDPDILAGYEIEMHSWGYAVQRGLVVDVNLIGMLGRVQTETFGGGRAAGTGPSTEETDEVDDLPKSVKNLRISGRILLDIWRVLRHEVALTSYTFENVMYHLAHERHSVISYKTLSHYWEHLSRKYRHIVVDYFVTRVVGIVQILTQLDFINRTSEFARLFGIQFYEVLSRGSQFRVESMMLRLAKPLNYVPASPSVAQRAAMRAPASLPLIMEPESVFYNDPIIVLDFQSLYPSMIIAYNYCFSTCLGRISNLGGREPFEFGCTQLQISPEELKELENDVTISPAGVAFVKANVRRGILPRMLQEILETRLMVKRSMKENKGDRVLQKVLHAQQLGLKLIANVTYGYTAANFSGRMPCIEVGDSVVSKGRETLHKAIQLVKNTEKWKARVVYGDTDSLFVLTPGRTREEAFQIGSEIAEAVTQSNPKPVKLKLEKVYQPSIMQTKKRYVGYMYESPDQTKPIFEAKGIETVRRDGCPAVGKILQKALQILFDTRNVSLVKKYTIRQFSKLFQGRSNIHDLIFAKEYRGRRGYRPGACVPALQLAKQWTRVDPRSEPRVKERVPYVIVNGPPGVPLIRLVRSPADLLADPSLRINAVYYITKAIIPPMHRCFSLVGVDVAAWYAEMPKKVKRGCRRSHVSDDQKKSTISQYFKAVDCVLCSAVTTEQICQRCRHRPQDSTVGLTEKIRLLERRHADILKICQSCSKQPDQIECQSLDCPVLYRRNQASRDLLQVPDLRELFEVLT